MHWMEQVEVEVEVWRKSEHSTYDFNLPLAQPLPLNKGGIQQNNKGLRFA